MNKYVIYNTTEELFWSNQFGWTTLEQADRYDEFEQAHPTYLVGRWIWVRVEVEE